MSLRSHLNLVRDLKNKTNIITKATIILIPKKRITFHKNGQQQIGQRILAYLEENTNPISQRSS